MKKNILGEESEKAPLLKGNQLEQGTKVSGYSTAGPFHCGDCLHRIGGYESDLPFCIHPVVIKDSKLRSLRTEYEGQKCVEIDMEHGCCAYVRQKENKKDKY
jgi:hypothetical protein